MPLVGFYLQPAVGGIPLSRRFWRRFAEIEQVIGIKVAPFNRYRTLDVVRGVVDARADDRLALYTGNDDTIVLDLLTPFTLRRNEGRHVRSRVPADCSATGVCGTRGAVELFARVRRGHRNSQYRHDLLATARKSPIATPRSSTSTMTSMAASQDVTKCCAGKVCSRALVS